MPRPRRSWARRWKPAFAWALGSRARRFVRTQQDPGSVREGRSYIGFACQNATMPAPPMSKLLFWGLTVLLLAGCGQASALPSKAGSSASQSSPPASLTPLPLVTDNISVGMSRLWLMDSAGIFRKYGFDPKIQY